ncbi:helix-turn-helix domain-containing protein [Methylobacterium hispanicum]|jgi:ATP-dependent DNA helicase RecG|nr:MULTISPECIES: ATP-binding protein [Methylobacterium]
MDEQFAFKLVPPRAELIQLWTPDEIYDRLDLYNIEQFVEDRRVERKSASVQPRALAEYLSMWSNTQPHGGIIIVGIDDSGRLSGCKKIAASHKNTLESLSLLCPDARWANKDVAIKNYKGEDDFVMVYRVNYRPDKLVETSGGEAFVREGDKKIKINEYLKRELRI